MTVVDLCTHNLPLRKTRTWIEVSANPLAAGLLVATSASALLVTRPAQANAPAPAAVLQKQE